ncbi:hypothetical protein LTR62_005382 [Meristemomyces frigidus]|uniref:NmrA-like domain-containing protein n=1 Tax=Meristemomyces frigidus TaxID=1508187 RepID=A0AAN7YFF5_9PEZI|nr:hypothetical protein LTR62_005382 [Meristemomyces frigidus]
MASTNRISRLVLVGASGNVGAPTLKHLLATSSQTNLHITVLTRPESHATFPSHPSLTVKTGTYDDPTFLQEVFAGQEAVMFALSFFAIAHEKSMIEAAARAGVRWIIPNEYAGDGLNAEMVDAVPVFHPKRDTRKYIEDLGRTYPGLRWIGVATNPFLEFCLQRKLFGIDQDAKTATLYPDAGRFNTTSLERIGLTIARLLALPITDEADPRSSLTHYANGFLYTSSFCVSQTELLRAIQRLMGSAPEEWEVDEGKTVKGWIEGCREAMKNGDAKGAWGLTFAYYMGEGLGGNYEKKAREDRRVLGLEGEEENLDEVVKRALRGGSLPKVV